MFRDNSTWISKVKASMRFEPATSSLQARRADHSATQAVWERNHAHEEGPTKNVNPPPNTQEIIWYLAPCVLKWAENKGSCLFVICNELQQRKRASINNNSDPWTGHYRTTTLTIAHTSSVEVDTETEHCLCSYLAVTHPLLVGVHSRMIETRTFLYNPAALTIQVPQKERIR